MMMDYLRPHRARGPWQRRLRVEPAFEPWRLPARCVVVGCSGRLDWDESYRAATCPKCGMEYRRPAP